MTEQVLTGGVKIFSYNRGERLKLDDERKRDIKEAYEKYYERKKGEKKRRRNLVIFIVILVIVLILLGIWSLLRG